MWEYSIDKGWRQLNDLLQEASSSSSLEEQIKAAGFGSSPASIFGQQLSDFYAEVYGPRQLPKSGSQHKYLIVVEFPNHIEEVVLPDFPDLVEFLSKLSSIAYAAIMRTKCEEESADK